MFAILCKFAADRGIVSRRSVSAKLCQLEVEGVPVEYYTTVNISLFYVSHMSDTVFLCNNDLCALLGNFEMVPFRKANSVLGS